MKTLITLFTFLVCLTLQTVTATTVDLYPFDKPEQQNQFSALTNQIRCLICQNESIADSNAPIANDLRQKVYNLVKDGRTNEEIKNYLVERYGEFVLFKPQLNAQTFLLWGTPILLLGFGFFILLIRIRAKPIN